MAYEIPKTTVDSKALYRQIGCWEMEALWHLGKNGDNYYGDSYFTDDGVYGQDICCDPLTAQEVKYLIEYTEGQIFSLFDEFEIEWKINGDIIEREDA